MSVATGDSQPRIEKLTSGHPIAEFDRGVKALARFLHRYASQNQKKDNAETWLALIGERVVGYYTLTVGEVTHSESPEGLSKGLARYPIPVTILARLHRSSDRMVILADSSVCQLDCALARFF
jgi:hypothetical protein